jgi:hypothetical protein
VIEIRGSWGFRSFSELFLKARSCYFGLFLFLSFQLFGESTKKPFRTKKGQGWIQNGEQLYQWVILCERRSGGSKSVVVLPVGHSINPKNAIAFNEPFTRILLSQ